MSRDVVFESPLSPEIGQWLLIVQKTLRTLRVYAENNQLLGQFLNECHTRLAALLERQPELTLQVRDDRLLFGKDPVLIDADRESGLPMIFYRNAFRRITLVHGMSRDELARLLQAITNDLPRPEINDDDLMTALWRLGLPHLRYVAIDSMDTQARLATEAVEREDLERLQDDVEHIIAKLYQTAAAQDDEDVVAGVSITKEDLE